jgi:hypothetical protein
MAYDFVVGKSNKVKDSPDIIGSIDFNELPAIGRLSKMVDSFFLKRIANLFEDAEFSPDEVDQAMKDLHPLLLEKFGQGERALLYKLISMLSYASSKKQSLFGVAD